MDKKPLPTLPEEPPEKTTSPKKVFAPSERSNRASPNSPKKDVKVVSSPPKPIKKKSTARTNSSYSYSNQSVFGDDSNEPCSSAQAEARYRKNSDTGYSSMSPRPTIFSKFPSEAAAQNDSADEAKMEEARIAELKKKGSPKTLVDIFKMEANLIPKKKGEDTKSEKESKQKKAKVVRPENMPVTAPNFFAGQEYGFHLTEMVNRGTETLLIIYES
ncbi:hypothetical protein B9Z55_024001 [Caenorhabditis nigoni]|uniref:Uncharacterized protein n=1 Tax=Caenorhabditis nigoni TaxID=1611254 RepID=A0A2G5SSZ4_9PELO|nr:hypothetical protein B9Z55_024001 [Caenorhabditis nigoni]